MKKLLYLLSVSAVISALSSCENSYEPYPYENKPYFTQGKQIFFGDYYKNYGVEHNINNVTLFSSSFRIDEQGNVSGFGQVLYLVDVVLPTTDTLLSIGTYTIDTTYTPFTFVAGMAVSDGKNVFAKGSQIHYYESDASKNVIKFISSGSFTVNVANNKLTIAGKFETADGQTINALFEGNNLPAFDYSLKDNAVTQQSSMSIPPIDLYISQ